MSKGIARRTGTGLTGRKTTDQLGEVRTLRQAVVPKLELGEVDCPVCTYPARRLDIDEPGVMKSRYYHAGRWVPCASPQRILTVTELAELLPPIRFSV